MGTLGSSLFQDSIVRIMTIPQNIPGHIFFPASGQCRGGHLSVPCCRCPHQSRLAAPWLAKTQQQPHNNPICLPMDAHIRKPTLSHSIQHERVLRILSELMSFNLLPIYSSRTCDFPPKGQRASESKELITALYG